MESSYSNDGSFNYLIAKFAGDASLLLNYDDLVIRFSDLLAKITPELYWKDSVQKGKDVPGYYRKYKSITKIIEEHPVFPNNIHDYIDPFIIGSNEEHLLLCLQGKYDEAFEKAGTDLGKEEVLLTQLLFGDIGTALGKRDLLEWESRSNNILFVAAIELFRYGKKKQGEEVYGLIQFNDWMMALMALGVDNHIPWKIYPYPDY